MLALALSFLLALFQTAPAAQSGVVLGVVKHPDSTSPIPGAYVLLLPPKYTEQWNRQLQTRMDNYWEMFKPEFYANKERVLEFERMAQAESFRYAAALLGRDLGSDASRFIKESSSSGQFEFSRVQFGTYQLLVQATINGREVIWSKTVVVKSDIPTFIDLGKPVS